MQRLAPITTARTIISEYSADDLELLIALEHDPDVMRFLNGVVPDVEKNKEKHEGFLKYYHEQPGFGVWKTCLHDGTHIGHAVLNHPVLSSTGLRAGPVQVGYTLHKQFWNLGFATELATAMLQHAFNTLQLKSVVAITGEENQASSRVMEKIGMTLQGTTDEYFKQELILYKIERQEWLDFTT